MAPINVVWRDEARGRASRLAADSGSAVIVRTAWVHSGGGVNFVKTAVRLLTAGTPMRVVDDQVGTPTRASISPRRCGASRTRPDVRGMLHFTDAGVASWFDVAVAVQETLRTADRLGNGAERYARAHRASFRDRLVVRNSQCSTSTPRGKPSGTCPRIGDRA